ncbi:DNA polymerase [Burkholderia ubonensis]|uniref:DNA polymerase n=1 Tax=Burkholderia ubonensis TaxID=101571 RepID=UPI000A512083|nr:DNA polymerase [Burkholderia ubonensis]
MAKKNVAVHIPLQMGFGFDVQNADGEAPPFLWELDEVYAALDVIQQSQWVSTDVETTGLTDASIPVPLAPIDIKQGASNVVRMRTIQARVPTIRGRRGERVNFVFDCDKMGPKLTEEVARAILSRRMMIAHNAGFDLYWLRLAEGRKTMPAMVVDTMLLTRLLRPTLVLKRAELVKDIKHINDVQFADEVAQAAWKSLISGASGGSLADVVLAMFGVVVDKTYQKPNNWTGLLGFAHYDYANDDTVWADRILCELLGVDTDGDLLQAYLGIRARQSTVRLIEPQVPELVMLRENGMPINTDVGRRYVIRKRAELAKKVDELIELEPTLEAHRDVLADPDAGLDEGLKKCLAAAFEARGVVLRRTAATGAAQVGEKDLRACKAVQIEASRPLFNAWVAVCRAKKSSAMALEVVGFSVRSRDGRVRSLLSHGPVTGRLSASEPNVQQFPRDQLFRAMCISATRPGCEYMVVVATELNKYLLEAVAEREVTIGEGVEVESAWMAAMFWSDKKVPDWPKEDKKALEALIDEQFTHKIVASDFGALDVRVGAALCVRSQREMLALSRGIPVPGPVQPPEAVVKVIRKVAPLLDGKDPAAALENQAWLYEKDVLRLETRLEKLKDDLDAERIQRKVYFQRRSELKDELLSVKLGWRLAQCLSLGAKRGEREYSALRDAFVADIDIHTFTGMKLVGRDPMQEFDGLSVPDRKALEKKLKKELGPRRQQGKIANLSLLYGMADAGFQEAAARGYDEHWSMEEAHDIRALWMNAYPEVELWHLWTECLQAGVVYVPEQGREKPVRTGWWMARTLAGRDIVAMGLNAALSYQDQSSGADILGLIMHRLYDEYPHIFASGINQVHDEIVFAIPVDFHDEHLAVIEQVMVECANSLTMPYGVPTAVSPACGPIWVKD